MTTSPEVKENTTLDVQARLEYARAAVAVLRSLKISNSTMRYGQLAVAIGMRAEGAPWQPWYRQQIRDILNLVAATEYQAGKRAGTEPLDFERIVGEDGLPGAGVSKVSRLVTTDVG
jgi:hypothetical protein